MKDSGNMIVYVIRKDAYENLLPTHAIKQDMIYMPNLGILAKSVTAVDKYLFFTDKKLLEEAERRAREGEGKARSEDADKVYYLAELVEKIDTIEKEFNTNAKELEERVMDGGKNELG